MQPDRSAREMVACFAQSVVLVLLGLHWTAAQAVVIAPVMVEISPTQRVASITVSNADDKPISYQSQVLSWKQVAGVDQYVENNQLIVVPPIAEIAAGGSQVFRVTTRLPPGPQETAFRLILEDVTQLATETAGSDAMQVALRVSHNLPVFFAAAGNPIADPIIQACDDAAKPGHGCVRIENAGNRHVVVRSLTLSNGNWRLNLPVTARVLGGAWKQWTFDLPGELTGSLHVSAETSAGARDGELPIE